jgi:hypothetical protein
VEEEVEVRQDVELPDPHQMWTTLWISMIIDKIRERNEVSTDF